MKMEMTLPTADRAAELQQQNESRRIAPHFHRQAEAAQQRKRAEDEHFRRVLLHIADSYNRQFSFARPGRAQNRWHIGTGYAGGSDWHDYTRILRLLKWSPGSNGVRQEGDELILSGTDGREARLPAVPARLLPHVAVDEPHPVGLFAVPVRGQRGVFACMGLADDYTRINPDLPISHPDARWVRKQKWVIVGFCERGHLVPECVARGTITLADILAERNDETRRLMIERFGADRYIRESGMVPVQTDDWGTLYDLGTHKVVRLINSTPNEDGTFNEYFRAVPSSCLTARAAVAWTFGLDEEDYAPAFQS